MKYNTFNWLSLCIKTLKHISHTKTSTFYLFIFWGKINFIAEKYHNYVTNMLQSIVNK